MKAVVAAFNQEKALVGASSVITNLRMDLFEALRSMEPADAAWQCDTWQCVVAIITIHHTTATDVTNVTNHRPRHLAPAPSYLDWAELGLISVTLWSKVKTSTIGRLHLCISTTCEINLVRPAVLAVVGLLSLSSFHCHIPLKIKTEWQAVSQIFTSAVLMASSTGCDRLWVCRLMFHASGVHC